MSSSVSSSFSPSSTDDNDVSFDDLEINGYPPPRRPLSPLNDDIEDGSMEEQHIRDLSPSSASTSRSLHFNDLVSVTEFRDCLICWEDQFYLSEGDNGGRSTGMMTNLKHFHDAIFKLESLLRTLQNDELIFHCMLKLRRTLVEEHLRKQRVHHRPWTIEMLRRHYNPQHGHRFDPEREAKWDLDVLRQIQQNLITTSVMHLNPETGETIVDPKIADLLIRLSRRRGEVLKTLETMIKTRTLNQQNDARQLIRVIEALTSAPPPLRIESGGGGGLREVEQRFLDSYDIGGF